MEDRDKFIFAKKLIFCSWFIAVTTDIIMHITGKTYFINHYYEEDFPAWVSLIFIFATVLMFIGLWKGSRGIDTPLTVGRFLNLLLGFPSLILVLIFVVLNILVPIIYREIL